jgi:hypothetical protein
LFGNFVNAKTVFNDNQATFWKDVVSYAGQVLNTNNNLQIDYFVYMPSSLNLKIENKFGNIYMDNHQGMLNIILSNGDLQARNVGADLRLDLEFGTATFQDVLDAEFNVNYSDCSIQDAGNITFESRSSTIDIDKVTSLDIKSSRDKFNVKHCGSLTGTSVFSHIKLGEMGNITNLNTKYGDLKLNGIAKNFNAIQLNSQYTDLLLCLSPVSPCSIDLNYDNKTVLNFAPTLNSQLKKEVINSKTGSIHASGTYGKAGTSDISISTKAGSITFLLK